MKILVAKFITIGYGDQRGYELTDASMRNAAQAHDARMKDGGAMIGMAGAPVQVRNHDDAGVRTIAGPYMHSSLPLAGHQAALPANLASTALRAR